MKVIKSIPVVALAFAVMMQRSWPWRALHFCSFLPCLITANAIRLFMTVALFSRWGKAILENGPHMALGWFQTIATVVFVYLCGLAIRAAASDDGAKGSDGAKEPAQD